MEKEFKEIHDIVRAIQSLSNQALREYTTIVEAIIKTNSQDVNHIERTLDFMLDFCGHAPMLLLYRKLCRHYYSIDPIATAAHIKSYQEWYDPERKAFGKLREKRMSSFKKRSKKSR